MMKEHGNLDLTYISNILMFAVCEELDAAAVLPALQQQSRDREGSLRGDPQGSDERRREMAGQDLRVVLGRGRAGCHGGLCHVSIDPGRGGREHGGPAPEGRPGLQSLRDRVPRGALLLHHGSRVLPLDPDLAVPGEGFRGRPSSEASSRTHLALCVDTVDARLVLRWSCLHPRRKPEIRRVPSLRGSLLPHHLLRHRSTSTSSGLSSGRFRSAPTRPFFTDSHLFVSNLL